jgi:predicted permease
VNCKLALRRLVRARIFTGVSVATLGLAIGLNAAVFSIADAVLFRPLPYADPDRLYFLRLVNRQTGRTSVLVPRKLVEALEAHGGAVAAVAWRGPVQLSPHTDADGTELIGNIAVAPNFLAMLGIRPLYGRAFEESDALQPGRAVLLAYASWRNRFGGERRVVGQSMTMAGYPRDIIGVLPRDFIFPSEGYSYPFTTSGRPRFEFLAVTVPRGRSTESPIVRLTSGVHPETAQSEIKGVVQSVAPGFEPRLVPVRSVIFPVETLPLRVLLLAAGFVFLLGCVNLSHLFLVRAQDRQHEANVSLALGATRRRVVSGLFLEAVLVGFCGALAALSIALIAFRALRHQVPTALSGGALMGVDWRVALFSLALGSISAVVFTAWPAWWLATAAGTGTILSGRPESSRPVSQGGFAAVVLQVAVAMILMAMAISATRHFVGVLREPLGFSPENVLTIDTMPSGDSTQATQAFYAETVQLLAGLPDVAAAGAVEALPLSGTIPRDSVPVSGADAIPLVRTLPGYFESAGIRLVRGRLFEWQDVTNSSWAVLSESAASMLFPGLQPVGQQLQSGNSGAFTVVGIVSDAKTSPGRAHDPLVYTIADPAFGGRMELIAAMRQKSLQAAGRIRQFVGGRQREMPVTTRWWSEAIDGMAEYRTPRFLTIVLGTVAALATMLAAIGVFGVVSCSTRRRMHEVAIRLALGAVPTSIARRMTVQTAWPVAIGLVVGVTGTWLMGRVLAAHLVGFRVWEWPVLTGGAAIIASTAMLSVYLPVRKATRLPAMTVLRAK